MRVFFKKVIWQSTAVLSSHKRHTSFFKLIIFPWRKITKPFIEKSNIRTGLAPVSDFFIFSFSSAVQNWKKLSQNQNNDGEKIDINFKITMI